MKKLPIKLLESLNKVLFVSHQETKDMLSASQSEERLFFPLNDFGRVA